MKRLEKKIEDLTQAIEKLTSILSYAHGLTNSCMIYDERGKAIGGVSRATYGSNGTGPHGFGVNET